MSRRIVPSVVLFMLLICDAVLATQPQLARVVVAKRLASNRAFGSSTPPFLPVSSGRLASSGFVEIADYPSRTLYEGPPSEAAAFVAGLKAEGYDAAPASDLDELRYLGNRIDPDSGAAVPPFPTIAYEPTGAEGIYILVLRGYPTFSWVTDLRARDIRLIESLSPAAYVARLARSEAATLKSRLPYVRSVFPISPEMKTAVAALPTSPLAYRHVVIRAVEESPLDNLSPYLEASSHQPPLLEDRSPNGNVVYVAWLSDLDITNLTHFENVYAIEEVQTAAPSTERQGMLVLRPETGTGRLELPAPLTEIGSYWYLLTHSSTPISNFSNTRVGIIDTGFDDGTATHPDFQFGGSQSIEGLISEFGADTADNRDGHGTITASIVTAFTNFNVRADADQYRFSLGIAPGVELVSDKFFSCSAAGDLTTALGRLKPFAVTVVNMSWNQCGGTGANSTCGYTAYSQIVDGNTRKQPRLFTISAGNTPDDAGQFPCNTGCQYVRGPATAKNALAVGSTENFTPPTWPNMSTTGVCLWNGSPAVRDARNIPSFSARRDPASMVKPDLVAPGTRISGPVTRATRCLSIFCNENIAAFDPPAVTYGMSAGTSFSAPAVAGAAAVVRKWYQNLTQIANPSPALVKAILINGARDVGGPPSTPPCPAGAVRNQSFVQTTCIQHIPDAYQGWGMLNLDRLLGPSTNYYFSDQNQHPTFTGSTTYWEAMLTVNDGSRPIRITLVYSDPAGNLSGVSPYRVKNDLSLGAYQTACSPCWWANNFDPVTGFSQPNNSTNDSTNNVEQIIIPPGYYASGTQLRVFVSAVDLEESIWGVGAPAQDFAVFAENAR